MISFVLLAILRMVLVLPNPPVTNIMATSQWIHYKIIQIPDQTQSPQDSTISFKIFPRCPSLLRILQ